MADNPKFIGPEFTPPDDHESDAGSDRGRRPQWLLPLTLIGCGCLGLPILLIGLGVFGLGNTALRLYRSSGSYQVYQLASDSVATDNDVIAALGEPVETGWTSQVTESYDLDELGKVCMRFSVTGSDRNGDVYTEAHHIDGAWQLHQLMVSVDGMATSVAVIPLTVEAQPLCPDFGLPETKPEEILPDSGTEI